MTAKNSQARISANARYNVKNYDVISFRVNKSENLNSKMDNAVKAIQAATGDKDYSKAKFMLDAIRAKLDGPQPVQEPPQPVATPATTIDITAFDNAVTVLLTPSMRRNMDAAINRNYAPNRIEYVYRAIDAQLQRDIDTENKKRSAVNAKAQAAYLRRMDIDMELEAMNNPPDDTPPDCV